MERLKKEVEAIKQGNNSIEDIYDLKNSYEQIQKEYLRKYKEDIKKARETYKDKVLKDEINRICSINSNKAKGLYDYFIDSFESIVEAKEKELEGMAREEKKALQVEQGKKEYTNNLLELTLIKDNHKALYTFLEANKDNKKMVDLIDNINFTLKDDDINRLINSIRNSYAATKIEQLKGILIYTKANGIDLTNYRNEINSEHYVLQ